MLTGKYSIKDIERLTGIKAHTIRVWEQRYGILQPSRTDTHIRVYDDSDLKKILKICFLNKKGLKISKLSGLNEEELSALVERMNVNEFGFESHINALINTVLLFNESKASQIIDALIEKYGFELCYEDVLMPVLLKTGILWQSNTIEPAQEHFISGIITKKLHVQTGLLPEQKTDSHRVILLQLPGDNHEISLLYINYLFRKHSVPVLYLGVSVPPENIRLIAEKHSDLFFYIHSVLERHELFDANLKKLISHAGENKIMLSGKSAQYYDDSTDVQTISSVAELKQLLSSGFFG